LAHVIARARGWIVAHGEAEASAEEAEAFEALCTRRSAGVPIAYLIGYAEFYGREFVVNERVLVPRPETEHLIDEALRFIRGPIRVLDVGTGCGAVACTVAAETNAVVDATDASRPAIEIAEGNARRLGLSERCRFHHGDLTEPLRGDRIDLVIANLPYIPTRDLPEPPNPASFEPRFALDGGPDGLTLYRRLLEQLPPLLNDGALILFEAAPPTIDKLGELVRITFPNFAISAISDYADLPRYIKAHDSRSEGLRPGAAAYGSAAEPRMAGAAESRAQRSAGGAEQASATPGCSPEGTLPPHSR
jgi:release factor glutamine methyltransferase